MLEIEAAGGADDSQSKEAEADGDQPKAKDDGFASPASEAGEWNENGDSECQEDDPETEAVDVD